MCQRIVACCGPMSVPRSNVSTMSEPGLPIAAWARPVWRCVVALVHRPICGVRPGDNSPDVPHRASGESYDWRREVCRTPPLPDVHSVRGHPQHSPNLLRACEESGIVHAPTIGGLARSWSACRQHLPTEISYTKVGSAEGDSRR